MWIKNRAHDFKRMLNTPSGVLLLAYPVLDCAARWYPFLGLITFVWIVGLLTWLFWVAGCSLCQLVAIARQERSWFTLAILTMWFGFLIGIATFPELISDENIMQAECPRLAFHELIGGGILNDCFLGYPSRSYVPQKLFAVIFGVSPLGLNIGASFFCFPGLILFAHGLRILAERHPRGDFVTGVALALLFQCLVLIRTLCYHDQTSHPFALTLNMVGLGVLAVWRHDSRAVFTLLALSLFSTCMYTPVLPVLMLVCAFLLWAVWKGWCSPSDKILVCWGLVLAAISFFQTLLYRQDLRLQVSENVRLEFVERLTRLGAFLLFQEHGFKYSQPVFHYLFMGGMVLGLLGLLGRYIFIINVWSLCVIVASFFTAGKSPDLSWWSMSGLHRALPVFAICVVVWVVTVLKWRWLDRYLSSFIGQVVIVVCVIVPALAGVLSIEYPTEPPLSYRILAVARQFIPAGAGAPILITRNDISLLGEIPKHLAHLDPQSSHRYYTGSCLPREAVPPYSLVVTIDDPICLSETSRDGFQEIASWTHWTLGGTKAPDKRIRVFRSSTLERSRQTVELEELRRSLAELSQRVDRLQVPPNRS